jgi:epoxyqueuosine reductase
MNLKEEIKGFALQCGFADIGFTTADPFTEQLGILRSMQDRYKWALKSGIDLEAGTDPQSVLPGAKSIIVLLDDYYNKSFPRTMERHFGRCYIDDDRITRDGLSLKVKKFRGFLRDRGIDSKAPFNLSHRVAAARAGLGGYGKNCLFYPHRAASGSSFVTPLAIVVDREIEADTPTMGINCPDWCLNACVAACPTRALKGNGTIDPQRCISYLTYYGRTITPIELREPMGLYIYGCDRCQDVCPRNRQRLTETMELNGKVSAKADNFDPVKLLRMDTEYFTKNIWPHMFYMPPDTLWKWKMNTARAMGNMKEKSFVPHLTAEYNENHDLRVKGMIIWALSRINSGEADEFLRNLKNDTASLPEELKAEILHYESPRPA